MNLKRHLLASAMLAASAGTASAQDNIQIDESGLELVAEFRLGSDTTFDGIPFGGISGLDLLDGENRYVALSDDRSEKGPARFYILSVEAGSAGELAVEIETATTIPQPDGTPYAEKTVDPEAIRYDAASKSYFWVSEVDAEGQAMLRQMAQDGAELRAFDLPAALRNTAEGVGHIASASLESLALSPDGSTLYTATENALQQDGPRAGTITGSPVRLLEIDVERGDVGAQYLYVTDPIGRVATDTEQPLSDNGLADLLSLGDGKFVAVERNGWHVGGFEFHFAIKAYLVDINGATDISAIETLADAEVERIQPVTKTLLADFNQLGLTSVDNIEAVALGPVVDGEQTLLFASDNNFDGRQINQFILLK